MVFAVIMGVGSVGVIAGVFAPARKIFGVAERLIYVGIVGWFGSVAIGPLAAS